MAVEGEPGLRERQRIQELRFRGGVRPGGCVGEPLIKRGLELGARDGAVGVAIGGREQSGPRSAPLPPSASWTMPAI
jgi:hypothetical protein